MQMLNTHRTVYDAAEAGDSAARNENREPPPPPPPLTPEVFLAQLLGSQRNTEQSQKNMEDFLHTIANNVQRGNNQGGGNGVNQYSSFKDFMDAMFAV